VSGPVTLRYKDLLMANIRVARARAHLSQKATAARMKTLGFGWTQQIMNAVETGERRLQADELLGLALALETSLTTLMSPGPDDHAVMLPGGSVLPAASVEGLCRGHNDGAVGWNGRAS